MVEFSIKRLKSMADGDIQPLLDLSNEKFRLPPVAALHKVDVHLSTKQDLKQWQLPINNITWTAANASEVIYIYIQIDSECSENTTGLLGRKRWREEGIAILQNTAKSMKKNEGKTCYYSFVDVPNCNMFSLYWCRYFVLKMVITYILGKTCQNPQYLRGLHWRSFSHVIGMYLPAGKSDEHKVSSTDAA